MSDKRDINFKKGGCAGRAAIIANKQCETECLTPSDECQDCTLSKMPRKCKSLPTSDCYKCSKLHSETFPVCKNESDIPKCMGEIIKDIEPSCVYCICSLACKLNGPKSKICKLCRDDTDDVDYSEYYLHSHALANPKCDDGGWILANDSDRCFKAFDGPATIVTFDNINCGFADASLAVTDTPEKVAASAEAARDGSKKQYWIGATCISDQCAWLGINEDIPTSSNFNRRCPKSNISASALRVNKKGKWCNLPLNKRRAIICEQPTCPRCTGGTSCCPRDGECINGQCTQPTPEEK